MRATTENGIEVTWQKQYDINTMKTKYRLDTLFGVVNKQPEMSGIMMLGIVTSTSAAAVAATLDTGAIMDTTLDMAIGDSFDWSFINTGGNTVTVTASTGHTIVGVATVLTVSSGHFRTRKTAASTFITYRMGGN
jgi:hypothetical protein